MKQQEMRERQEYPVSRESHDHDGTAVARNTHPGRVRRQVNPQRPPRQQRPQRPARQASQARPTRSAQSSAFGRKVIVNVAAALAGLALVGWTHQHEGFLADAYPAPVHSQHQGGGPR